ncbi:MAG: signal transduction histidine kinase, partial [Bacteroidia bacterium]
TNAPDFPLPDAEGFRDIDLEGEEWRLYAKKIDERIWMALVANKSGANALILDNLSPALWFLLLVLPLTIIAVVYGIHRSTQPIVELEKRMRDRSPRSLDPLDPSDVPAEVEPLVDAVNELLGRVRNLVSHEHRFVANAAHELQTPLAAIKTELENARRLTPNPDLAQTLARLEQRVNRSVYSVKQLLTLARLDPEVPLERQDQVNLEHIIYDELAAQGDEILRLELECNVQCQTSQLNACNSELVTILVRNLIENAIKYANIGTEVDISVTSTAREIRLQVANDCPALSLDTLLHLRDSFFRVPGNDATGAGLGLTIVDRIADLHGGTLDVKYRENHEGLAVTAIFPFQQ